MLSACSWEVNAFQKEQLTADIYCTEDVHGSRARPSSQRPACTPSPAPGQPAPRGWDGDWVRGAGQVHT